MWIVFINDCEQLYISFYSSFISLMYASEFMFLFPYIQSMNLMDVQH